MTKGKDIQNESLAEIAIDPDVLAKELSEELEIDPLEQIDKDDFSSGTLNKNLEWILFGIFSALGFLSKYLFIYILLALFIFFISNFKKYKKSLNKYFFSIVISLVILTPHFFWLFENNFITIFYGLTRSGVT